ncbi:hypothetical protein V8D89_004651, partial [Ganoderma adspersum]
ADYASGLNEDPWSSAGGWSVDRVGLGACFDADQALFEELLNAEVTSTSPSGPCTVAPMQSLPFCDQEVSFNPSSSPYPSLSPEPSRQASQWSHMFAHPAQSPASLAFEHTLPDTTTACISPELIYPPAQYDLEDDRWPDASPQSSRASHRSSSSSPYPSPSPEPSLRRSPIVKASQRRNAPARTAALVPATTPWQCPYCPHVQRNRRSPDLKRHINTRARDMEVADWVCCGVPVMNAAELGVPAMAMREAQVFDFDGVLMIGGCKKAFSRRDALRRHLLREKGKCFGDALSLHQRGNRESC